LGTFPVSRIALVPWESEGKFVIDLDVNPILLLNISLRIMVPIALGAAIGLERQWRLRTAGIRTNALVSVGSVLFVVLGPIGIQGSSADPARVAAQIVSRIGFLGASVILRDGFNIRGLTITASLWCAAAIGSLAGAGMLMLALIGCAAIVATNTLLRSCSRYVSRRARGGLPQEPDDIELPIDYLLEVVTSDKSEQRLQALAFRLSTSPSSPDDRSMFGQARVHR